MRQYTPLGISYLIGQSENCEVFYLLFYYRRSASAGGLFLTVASGAEDSVEMDTKFLGPFVPSLLDKRAAGQKPIQDLLVVISHGVITELKIR